MVEIPRDLLAKLYAVYRYYWFEYGTVEAPSEWIQRGYSGMVHNEDDFRMEQLCLAVEPFDGQIRSIVKDEN